MSDDTSAEPAYASPRTLEGLLQRGRGLGALRVLDEPEASVQQVYDVVREDWRWDTLVDDRDLYLARLIRESELSLGPVLTLLAGDADDCDRATRILELLALSGSAEAREALRAYVREGEHWGDVLESVADVWPLAWWDDLAEVARARLGDDRPRLWHSEPWVRWRLGAETHTSEGPCRPCPPDMIGIGEGSGRLLDVLADGGAGLSTRIEALRLLAGRPPDLSLVPLVPSLAGVNGELPLMGLESAVLRLGPLAVPAAREWAVDGHTWLSRIGVELLAEHGTLQDLPFLLEELEAHEAARQWCGPATLADGIARFGAAGAAAAPVLRRLWLRTPHSYERPDFLRALAAVAPSGLDFAFAESLWDCESDARLLGIAHAPDHPRVRERLALLRDDPMEGAEVRAAAGERLVTDGR
ncbi:hypothetical protein [Streptomyces griseiscabiei]|uniref:HEAT repeat domain-containing protein n=1 Tax=Streptomyces griseiscabiei TaxID=2993540 RepID=A0ABU4L1A6_9ACTN|nr:hypothetical protein [Streptomyces griseiscabiei]MBZ3905791.1 hypothetical protein [Streptomyces griseiscabiei]MDX2909419.1 hypothetical protein [Streptomyces griseiscabiei]